MMILRRLLMLPFLLVAVSLITFFLTSIVPGDIAEGIIIRKGGEPSEELIATYHDELGLNQGLFTRYGEWLGQAMKLDLGTSWVSEEPVVAELAERIVPTFILTGASIAIGIVVTLLLGTLAAYFKDTWIDRLILGVSLVLKCIPEFLLAFILLYFFAYHWAIFPLVGYGSFKSLILPSVVLGLGIGAAKARLLRSSILEVWNLDYITMARSKGLSKGKVLMKHALRNALIPITTTFGASVGHLLGGTVIIENIFNWPGLGRLALQAINTRDIPVLQGYVLFITIVIILVYLIVDLLYMYIDPRVKGKGGSSHGSA